jgi:hypothetical protein
MVPLSRCCYREDVKPEELYHESRLCKKTAVLCHHPDVQIKVPNSSIKLLRVASVDCTAVSCALFTGLDDK